MDELLLEHANELREIGEMLERFQKRYELSAVAAAAMTAIRNDAMDRQRKAEREYAEF